jgi:hypothetical protein
MNDRGVYFLANDRLFDLVVCFLNSFRKYNPSLNLCLVPFDENFSMLTELQERYRFSIFQDAELFRFCDSLELKIKGYNTARKGCLRKCAMWDGPFRKFVYMDVDMVILEPIDFVFELLREYDFIASASSPNRVWLSSAGQSGLLKEEQIQFSASTGFIASHNEAMSVEKMRALIPELPKFIPHFHKSLTDQPFLNFLMVRSGKKFATIPAINAWTGQKFPRDMPESCGLAV